MLPGKDGFAVVAELRDAKQFVPVLMLTARGRPEDVLKGFAAGADDYLPKPTELAILLARDQRPAPAIAVAAPSAAGPLHLRRHGRSTSTRWSCASASGRFPLTLMEANLLRYLVKHEGKAVSRKAMLEDVWGLHEDTDTRAIDNFIVPAAPLHRDRIRRSRGTC